MYLLRLLQSVEVGGSLTPQMCLPTDSDPVKQELGKEGILPFSKFWARDWPASAPTGKPCHLMLLNRAHPVTQVEYYFTGSSALPISSGQTRIMLTAFLPLSPPSQGTG